MIQSVHSQARRLTSYLVEAGAITEEQVKAALAHQRITGARIGETLVELGVSTEEDIAWALARQLDIPFVDVQLEMLDRELLAKFPPTLLDRLQAVPLLRTDSGLSTAMADPTDADAVSSLEHYAGAKIEPSAATPSAIARVLREVCQVTGGAAPPHGRSGASFLTSHLADALDAGASELYWVTVADGLQASRRIGGRLMAWTTEPAYLLGPLLNRLEALGLAAPESGDGIHRTGQIQVEIHGRDLTVEVSVLMHERGTSIRLKPMLERRPRTLGELGLAEAGERAIREALAQPAGLMIVNAPPGAGASTTLSCLIEAASGSNRRVLVFSSASSRPGLDGPADALRVTVPVAGASYWEEIVLGQDPEVVVLDDLTSGDRIPLALSPALAGRIVLARTDWDDPFALLEFFAYSPRTRAAACDRLLVVLDQRRLRAGEGSSPGKSERWVVDPLIITPQLRQALHNGASADELREITMQGRYRAPGVSADGATS